MVQLARQPSGSSGWVTQADPATRTRTVWPMLAHLVQLSDHVWDRTRTRLDGLTDKEYFWEPVPDCWSIRPDAAGALHPDWSQPGEAAPVTTVGWRLCHLIVCYGARRNREWLGLPVELSADRFEMSAPAPATAGDALGALAAAHLEWDATLQSMTEATLDEPLGAVAGPFAGTPRTGFVLHMLDEFIHHGAEVALLRDLFRASSASGVSE